jgi:hypothetical protein
MACGVTGTVVVWDWYNSASKRQFRAGQTVLRGHVHVGILRFYGDLIRSAKNVSVITCYGDLLSLLHDTFGVSAGESLLIPPQAQNIKGTADAIHFPDRYRAIVSELRARKRVGELFFVGAGLVGKLYCEEIRKAGGMAIDVGSLMDVWMGIGARQYQGNGFVEKYSLTPRQADVRAQSTAAS